MGQAPDGAAYDDSGEGWPLLAGAGDFGDGVPAPKKFTREAAKPSVPGDIIMGIRTSIGGMVRSDGEYCLGRGVAALRSTDLIDGRFLWHWLEYSREVLASKARGATFKQVNRDDIGEHEIPVPPRGEQRHIAEVLDRAEALRAKRRTALAQIDGLTQAIFLEMFGDPVTNPRRWPVRRTEELGDVITGNTPPRNDPSLFGDAIDWVKSDNLTSSLTYVTRSTEGLSEKGKVLGRIVPSGSILVTCIAGSPACIGNAAVADREVAFNQQINALVPKISETLFLFVQIILMKRAIQDVSTGGMKGMVSKSRFEGIRFIHPPVQLQAAFASRAAAVDKLKAAHRASLAHLDALFVSLQHRAFRGEL